ncbi:Spy/CpxP family protein refolding chaperone [Thiocystis violacea]|uniref:Spy/CpxP family protein refolding chaperone n=1 Tax=Thiocystis violacea TaxID=13725 RepID=UPI00190675BD|nr:pilus assembly protein [Thiocystis violacea]MBK1717035.1 pilus assembly protein [Thiocystis violacea]
MNQHRIRTGLMGITAATGLLLGASLVGADTASARSDEGWRPDPGQRAETYSQRMAKDLDLTEAQQTEIRKIMAAEQAQRDLQRIETRKQVSAVLTDAQRAKREDMIQTRMERDLDRMTDRLDLTDDQVTQIKALFDEQQANPELTRTQLRERIAAVLTDEQRAHINDRKRSGGDR